ncbi:MAG: T9SS type A sorting domain-containing protein [Bacteroidales bacterium]|nr:T9SS type A sorting domain-containing protein [Bacteroidales bacterium]
MIYHIEEAGDVRLRIYNLSGRLVKEVLNQSQSKGGYTINVDLTGLNSGNYIYRLETGNYSKAKKLVIK